MGKLTIAILLVAACKHDQAAPPPSPLQDGAVIAIDARVAAIAVDAAPAAAQPTTTKVVVGAHATCAVMSDHTVRCWGANGDGQLGDGTQRDATDPVMPAIRGVRDLVLGADHACVLLDDSSVACWGKIGFGAKPGPTLVPTGVPGVVDMVRVFAIGGAGCSTAKDGALVCWGDVDARGHVTTAGAHHTPTPVPGVDHVTMLAARAALREDGDLSLWLDDGTPVRAGVTGMTELATRDAVTCALGGDHLARCFGAAAPCAPPPPPPPAKPAAPPQKSVIRGRGHGPRKAGLAAVKASTATATAPSSAAPTPLPFGGKVLHLAFDTGICAVSVSAKQLVCIDPDHACKLSRPWPALVNVEEVSGACARLKNGTVRCGGSNSAAPVIAGVTTAIQLSATQSAGCAVSTDGCVTCWPGTVSTKTTCGH